MQQLASSRRREPTAFSIYLRTGRRFADRRVEVKFNPWHDPANGQFTFAGRGSLYRGSEASAADPQSSRSKERQDRANYSDPNYTDAQASAKRNDPKNPQNYSVYVVRRGDNLTRIAKHRKGLTAEDLAWLNEVPLDRPLQIGQRIKVPHQQYLDDGREKRNKIFALDYYVRAHRGQLPPDPQNPPSLESQILDSNWRREAKNGYEFYIDATGRSRQAYGLLHFGPSERSRMNQKGVQDRVPSDDGGHYIAARFEGPSDSFNHFAQNANFNRGAYRLVEDKWAEALRRGGKVFVNIIPHYQGTSKRPDRIDLSWSVNGRKYQASFPNAPKGKADGAR